MLHLDIFWTTNINVPIAEADMKDLGLCSASLMTLDSKAVVFTRLSNTSFLNFSVHLYKKYWKLEMCYLLQCHASCN